MAMLAEADRIYGFGLNLGEVARIWRGGCIIRAQLLELIRAAFAKNPALPNLLLDPAFAEAVVTRQQGWREALKTALDLGIPTPGLSESLAYFDSYRTARLPANLIQAQRDYFGAHTYKRIDKEGAFHTEWQPE
jgi:6-phosphogluconate dehydrogenase